MSEDDITRSRALELSSALQAAGFIQFPTGEIADIDGTYLEGADEACREYVMRGHGTVQGIIWYLSKRAEEG